MAFLYSNSEYGYDFSEVNERLGIPIRRGETTLERLSDENYLGTVSGLLGAAIRYSFYAVCVA